MKELIEKLEFKAKPSDWARSVDDIVKKVGGIKLLGNGPRYVLLNDDWLAAVEASPAALKKLADELEKKKMVLKVKEKDGITLLHVRDKMGRRIAKTGVQVAVMGAVFKALGLA